MYKREYCYIRRAILDRKNNLMVLISRSTDHPKCPLSPEYVRVETYESRMVIRPHNRNQSFEENGFDYLLTYFDDPQSNFPSAAYNWMAKNGAPDFATKLHDAALQLHQENLKKKSHQLQMMHLANDHDDPHVNNDNDIPHETSGNPDANSHRDDNDVSSNSKSSTDHQTHGAPVIAKPVPSSPSVSVTPTVTTSTSQNVSQSITGGSIPSSTSSSSSNTSQQHSPSTVNFSYYAQNV